MISHTIGKEGEERPEFDCIVEIVEPGSRVLDLGCGNGALLLRLAREKGVKGRGIEISEKLVSECIGKHLSVYHGDIEQAIKNYPDGVFDYVILNKTLQVTRKPRAIIGEMLRVGKKAIISFPNFAHWKIRFQLLLWGKMPKSKILPFEWYDTPNIHLTTIRDFKLLCKMERLSILGEFYIA
ncbi:MAG: methionine biosynthesis protein MetW, partial [Candidatus Methanosuratincola sp.]